MSVSAALPKAGYDAIIVCETESLRQFRHEPADQGGGVSSVLAKVVGLPSSLSDAPFDWRRHVTGRFHIGG